MIIIFECGWGSPPWYCVSICIRQGLWSLARLEGSVEVKSSICRYGPVDCAQAVMGEGLTVGKGVKSTHSDPGWLVLSVSGPRKNSPLIFYGLQFRCLMLIFQQEQVNIA